MRIPSTALRLRNTVLPAILGIGLLCSPTAWSQLPPSSTPVPVAPQPVPSDTVTMNFVNADVLAVIKAVADITGRNLLVDPRVSGTVTIITPKPVPRNLVWGIFLSALRAQGLAVVGGAEPGVMRIVPEAEAKFFGGPVGRPRGPGDQIITEVFILENERAQQLVPALRPLVSPNNVVNAAPAANALIITDYAENLERIREVIRQVDRPTIGDIIAIPLKYASANDLLQIVQKLVPEAMPMAAPGQGGAVTRLTAAVDPRTNSILVRSDNQALASRIRALAATLDTPSSQPGNIHVVYLRNADATRMADSLRALLGGQPGQGGQQQQGSNAQGVFGQGQGAFPGAQQGAGFPGQQGIGQGMLTGATGQLATLPPITGGATPGGVMVQAYPEQNSIVIVAPDPIYNALRAVIDKLDARRAQIFVEALIVEVTSTRAAEFGIQWQDLGGLNRSGTQFIGAQNFPNSAGSSINTIPQNLPTLGQGLSLGVVNGTLTIGNVKIANLQILARALQTDSDANILSTPNLVTLDNEEARIIVGQNIPITTGSFTLTGSGSGVTNPFQTFTRQDIGVALRVRPQVAEAGTVKLGIYQEVSSIRDQTNPNGIILNKRAVESQVVVDDGQIIVLGGLISDDVNSTVQSVPVLGQLPFVGWLFRYSNRQRDKTNLMIFLRPFVIRDSATSDRITGDRYEFIRQLQGGQRLPSSLVLPDMPTPQLPPQGTPGPIREPTAPPISREEQRATRVAPPAEFPQPSPP